jgi:hypothetical protein
MADIDPQRIALELDVDIDKVKALADEGLTEEQIHALLTNPMAVIEWITETTVEGDAVSDPDGSLTRAATEAQQGSGGLRQGLLPRPSGRGKITTTHKGSAFNKETSRLTMTTEFAWDRFALTSVRVTEHRSKKTWWGSLAGYHVEPSYEGSSGWINEPTQYRTEVKADWKVVAHHKDFEVESGTAWVQHTVNGFGMGQAATGGWSY